MLTLIAKLDFVTFFISVIFAFVVYSTSGLQYYFIRKNQNITLKIEDIFLLPIVGNLWSYLIPFQGNSIFVTLFFKLKYGVSLDESIAVSVFMYLTTIFFAGLVGLLLSVLNLDSNYYLFWISLVVTFSPIFFLSFFKYTSKPSELLKKKQNYFYKVIEFFKKVGLQTNILLMDKQLIVKVLFLNILRTIMIGFWFYYLAFELKIDVSFLAFILLSLLMDVSVIIKMTPDNLGTIQLVSAGLFAGIGYKPEYGVILTLLSSATCLFLLFTVGILANLKYLRSFNISFKEVISQVK